MRNIDNLKYVDVYFSRQLKSYGLANGEKTVNQFSKKRGLENGFRR